MTANPHNTWLQTFLKKYPHVWYLLIWLVHLIVFSAIEHLIVDDYWVSYLPIDDKIPFCRYFIIPYCTWHPLLAAMTIYLFFCDAPAFKRFMVYIGLGFGLSMLVCLVLPNGQNLRPASFAQDDIFTRMVQMIYAADTNTNVLPSMHVVGCAALTLACFDAPGLKKRHLQWVMVPLGLLISASTVFVKQHSMLDVLTAIPLCIALCLLIYRPFPRDRLKERA